MERLGFRFLTEARDELFAAADYYEHQRTGLGREFQAEVERGIELMRQNPRGWGQFAHRTRRFLTHRFPYAIVYQVKSDHILIIAVMHLHRRPGYWRDRVVDL